MAITLDGTEGIQIPDGKTLGSASDSDAIAIASGGAVTFSQRDVHSAGITVADGGQIGSASDADAVTIASGGAVTFSQRDVHSSGITVADGGQIGSASDADAISIASGGTVTMTQALTVASGTYNPGLYIGDAAYKFYVNAGYLYIQNNTGGVYLGNGSTSWGAVSDERKKDIIEHISDALTKVNGLRAVIGKFKVEETYDDDVLYSEAEWKPTGKNTGDVKYAKGSAKVGDDVGVRRSFLIAQDVQAVLPEAVDASDSDNLTLRYTDVIPLLVASIKELKAKVETLESEITALKGGG